MQNPNNATFHYCCIYAAKGIIDPNKKLDSALLKDENVVVRLLGSDAYENLVWRIVSPAGKKGIEDLDDKAREKLELRRNSLILQALHHAVIHVESCLPLDIVRIYQEENSELPAYVKAPLKKNAERAFKSVSAAMTFARGNFLSKNYDFIHEQYYVTDDQSTVIQKLHPATISDGDLKTKLSMEEVQVTEKLASILHNDKEINKIIDIYSESLTPYKSGHLHAFIAAWTALEMFVATQFKEIQSSVAININGTAAHNDFSSRMLAVMKDKYRLVDKFAALSSYYEDADADEDIAVLKSIKEIRDKFFHTMEGEIKDLPLDQTRELISKYLQIYLERKCEGFVFQKAAR
ncbi:MULTISPECIES: hypothetical protein [Rhodocyclales]|jgi:hypothetical protein|uniref:Apea-like HEPN domain-containing protein n=1 Tax=Zoogloea oleivorans TaxID=1552750 RepID=A0A6C2CIH9_9RHOO|nr:MULTISPECIES: hypothetical protein [Rhodocyclales]TYC53771.1 hypothetical protein ETQ85_20830 [Zoogloea oleivorans]BBN88007.1 hypothetical protein AZSP09_10300 [Azospira sp. I09]